MHHLTLRISDDAADALMKTLLEDCATLCAASIREALTAIAKGGSSHHADNLRDNLQVFEAASTLMKYYTGEPLKLSDVVAKLPPSSGVKQRRQDVSRKKSPTTVPSRPSVQSMPTPPKGQGNPPSPSRKTSKTS